MEPKYEKQFRNAQKMLTSEVSMMAEAYGDTDEFHAKIGELRSILRTVGDYENSFLKLIKVIEDIDPEECVTRKGTEKYNDRLADPTLVKRQYEEMEEGLIEKMEQAKDVFDFDKHEWTLKFESQVAFNLERTKNLREFKEQCEAKKEARAKAEAEKIDSE